MCANVFTMKRKGTSLISYRTPYYLQKNHVRNKVNPYLFFLYLAISRFYCLNNRFSRYPINILRNKGYCTLFSQTNVFHSDISSCQWFNRYKISTQIESSPYSRTHDPAIYILLNIKSNSSRNELTNKLLSGNCHYNRLGSSDKTLKPPYTFTHFLHQ